MIRKMLIAAVVATGLSTPTLADVPGRNWISSAKVAAMLAKRGYRVTKIEADDGHWEGDAVRRGLKYEFHVDPRSGQVTKMKRDRD